MPIHSVRELTDNWGLLSEESQLHAYNALDVLQTNQIFEAQQELRDEYVDRTYTFSRAMQKPALTMMRRGIKIDLKKRTKKLLELADQAKHLQNTLNLFAGALWDKPLLATSPQQVAAFLYDFLQLDPPYESVKGVRKERPTGKKALEHFFFHPTADLICRYVLAVRDVRKQASTLNSAVSPDGRMRCGYQVVGTETGRWSSNKNCFGTGTNLQNITKNLREVFLPDPGMVLCYADLARAEAVVVAYAADDDGYIAATTGGDTHLSVARMCWPALAWTGEDTADKDGIGATIVPGTHFSHRDLAKRAAHGTNYYGRARTIATALGISVEVADTFQRKYFQAYDGIKKWHHRTSSQLQRERAVTTPYFNRRRRFLSRPNDDATLREAIAYVPQSMVGDILNIGLYRVWQKMECELGIGQILAQVHDAILLQCRPEHKDAVTAVLKECMEFPITFPSGKTMTIQADVNPSSFGRNWKEAS